MIVKFDRGLLKVQIAWGLFFSLVPLCLIISSLLNDSLYEDYFGKLFLLFFLLFPLYAGIYAVDGIMNLRKNKEIDRSRWADLHLLWETFWPKNLWNPLIWYRPCHERLVKSHSRYQAFIILSLFFEADWILFWLPIRIGW